MYITEQGGLIPSLVAEHHKNIGLTVITKAIEEAGIKIKGINLISISQGPGLPLSLSQGMKFAKELSIKYNIPLIGVNHICAHLEIGKLLTKVKDKK